MNIKIVDGGLSAEEYVEIKTSAGWGAPPKVEHAKMALDKSLFHVVARDGDKAVGMGRLLGDSVYYWHVQDLVILPEYQGKGIGAAIMEHLTEHIKTNSPPGKPVNIGLLSVNGKEGFYEKLGFMALPNERTGHGMQKNISIPEKE